ncbi:MAG: polysaccharide biosynthesis/export family protein [Bryobacteraceae bacterium]|nr:polysaccharide biosynthesis/export family protein [Bryobacteraceae bacterium]
MTEKVSRRRGMVPTVVWAAALSVAGTMAFGQPAPATQNMPVNLPVDGGLERLRLNYVLGANDQILIRVPQVEEMHEKVYRIDADGNVYLPTLQNVKLAGLTVEQAEAELVKMLRKFYQSPAVSISVAQYKADPIFLLGAFRAPGIYPLIGRRTLVETLSSLGGLQPNASRRIKITRRLEHGKIPLRNATEDRDRNISVAELNLSRLMETVNPEEDIVLKPFDILRVGIEEMVYVSGEVGKGGAFPLTDRDSISVMQILALIGGLGPNADPANARILRPVLDSARRAEIPVNLKAVMQGTANDMPLLPNDVLVIPKSSGLRHAMSRVAWYVGPATVGTLVWVLARR